MQQLLITDLDSTLYNFTDYFGQSFRGMVHALSKETKIEEDTIIQDFKEVYSRRGSLEYGFAVQELNLAKSLTQDQVFALIKLAKGAFKRNRDKYLIPYDTVKETLEWVHRQGILIVGISNAPFYNAQIRLKQLFIDKYFFGLAAWEGPELPLNEYTETINQKMKEGKYTSSKIEKSWVLKKQELKPSVFGYKKILDDLKISPKNTYIIGDSILKDVQPALEIGAKGIWAKYGEECQNKNLETVLRMTNWSESEIKKVFFDKHQEPELIVNYFGELRKIIQPNQLTLFNEL